MVFPLEDFCWAGFWKNWIKRVSWRTYTDAGFRNLQWGTRTCSRWKCLKLDSVKRSTIYRTLKKVIISCVNYWTFISNNRALRPASSQEVGAMPSFSFQSALQRQINFLRFLDSLPVTLRCLFFHLIQQIIFRGTCSDTEMFQLG